MSDKKVTYNKNTLALINELSIINPQIILEKDESKKNVIIKRTTPGKTLAYIFTTPVENFDFDGDEIAFYNYPEFYQLFSCFDNPSLRQENNRIYLSKDNANIKYLLSDVESLKRGPKKVNFESSDCSVKLSSEDMKELQKMIGIVNAEKVELNILNDEISIKIFNTEHDNSFEKKYKIESSNKNKIKMQISSEIFKVVPKENYLFEIKKEGITKFSFEKDKTLVELYTAELEEN